MICNPIFLDLTNTLAYFAAASGMKSFEDFHQSGVEGEGDLGDVRLSVVPVEVLNFA
jgi:hypothetical protein